MNKGQMVRTTDLYWKSLIQKLKAFTPIFTKRDLHFRRHVKLGTHSACLLKYLLFLKESKKEEEGNGEGTSSPPPMLFCKTFFYCDVSQNVSRNLNVLAFPSVRHHTKIRAMSMHHLRLTAAICSSCWAFGNNFCQ